MGHNYDSDPSISYEDVVTTIRKYPSSMLAGLFFEVTRLSIENGVFQENGGIERCIARVRSNLDREIPVLKALSDIGQDAEDSAKITSKDLAFTINCTAFQASAVQAERSKPE